MKKYYDLTPALRAIVKEEAGLEVKNVAGEVSLVVRATGEVLKPKATKGKPLATEAEHTVRHGGAWSNISDRVDTLEFTGNRMSVGFRFTAGIK